MKKMGDEEEDGDDEDGVENDHENEEGGLKLIKKKNFSGTKINSGVILHHF